MTNIDTMPGSGKIEAKVKAATWAAFAVSLLGTTVLEWAATDLIPALPNSLNWLVPIVSAALTAGLTFASGYLKRSRPDSISESTVDAVKKWLRERAPRVGGNSGLR
jgi:hypothetical protein